MLRHRASHFRDEHTKVHHNKIVKLQCLSSMLAYVLLMMYNGFFLFKKASKVASKRQYFWRGEGYSYAEILLRFKSSVIVVRQK